MNEGACVMNFACANMHAFIEEAVVALLRQLDRQRSQRPITIKMLQIQEGRVSDDDDE